MRKRLMFARTVCRSTPAQLPRRSFDARERPWLWDVFCKVCFFGGGRRAISASRRDNLCTGRGEVTTSSLLSQQTGVRRRALSASEQPTTSGHKMFPASRYSSRGNHSARWLATSLKNLDVASACRSLFFFLTRRQGRKVTALHLRGYPSRRRKRIRFKKRSCASFKRNASYSPTC